MTKEVTTKVLLAVNILDKIWRKNLNRLADEYIRSVQNHVNFCKLRILVKRCSRVMDPLPEKDIIKFLKDNIDPSEDNSSGKEYRASVTLIDGTLLPCVIFRNTAPIVNLAIRRFKEEQTGKSIFAKRSGLGYPEIVKTFVASGNRVNHYDIAGIGKSRFAFPLSVQKQIKGETSMGWTAFVAKFKDGRLLNFGTTWSVDFFDLPPGYEVEDVEEIINHSYLLKTKEVVTLRHPFDSSERRGAIEKIYRNRPYFECFLDGL